jgi:hypothetical protein
MIRARSGPPTNRSRRYSPAGDFLGGACRWWLSPRWIVCRPGLFLPVRVADAALFNQASTPSRTMHRPLATTGERDAG